MDEIVVRIMRRYWRTGREAWRDGGWEAQKYHVLHGLVLSRCQNTMSARDIGGDETRERKIRAEVW